MNDPRFRTLTIEREFPHPPEKIWRALTEDPSIPQWLMGTGLQSVAGHRFTRRTDPMPHSDGIVDCKVLSVRLGQSLSHAWNNPPAPASGI